MSWTESYTNENINKNRIDRQSHNSVRFHLLLLSTVFNCQNDTL